MIAKTSHEYALPAERRHLRERFKTEVATLELALAQVAPFSERDRPPVIREQPQRITMHKVLGQNVRSGQIKLVRFSQIQVLRKDFEHVRAALSDIVR